MVKRIYIAAAAILLIVVIGIAYFEFVINSGPVVQDGDTVSVYYTGKLSNGTVFNSNVGQQPLQFVVGSGQLITGFDDAVVGMKLNQTKTVTIPANQAYGEINSSLITPVPLSRFGNQSVQSGMQVTESLNGQQYQGTVESVNATVAVLNFNPPLAGKNLTFTITIAKIIKKTQ